MISIETARQIQGDGITRVDTFTPEQLVDVLREFAACANRRGSFTGERGLWLVDVARELPVVAPAHWAPHDRERYHAECAGLRRVISSMLDERVR